MTIENVSPRKKMKSRRSSGVDDTAPLLPKSEEDASFSELKGGSFSGAVFNLSTAIVGAGLMSLPAVMKVLGLGIGVPLIVIVAFLTEASIEMLLRFSKAEKCDSYAGIMGIAFGNCGRIVLQVSVLVANAGVLVVYMIIIGDVLSGTTSGGIHYPGLLETWFGEQWWTSRVAVLLITTLAVFSPLACFKRIDSLRYTSALSVALVFVFLFVMVVIIILKLFNRGIGMPRFLPYLEDMGSFWKLFTVAPVLVTAFNALFYGCRASNVTTTDLFGTSLSVHNINNELEDSTQMTAVVRSTIGLCSVMYLMTSIFGFLLFGDATLDDVLANFDTDLGIPCSSLLNNAVRVSYAVHLAFVFPVVFYTLRFNVDGLLFPSARPLYQENMRFTLITAVLITLMFLGSTYIPSIWDAFQLTGATAATCGLFIFPAAITLRDRRNRATKRDKILSIFMIVIAVVANVVAMYSNISALLNDDSVAV